MPDYNDYNLQDIPTNVDIPYLTENDLDLNIKGYSDAPPVNPNIPLYKPNYSNETHAFVEQLRRDTLSDLSTGSDIDPVKQIINSRR